MQLPIMESEAGSYELVDEQGFHFCNVHNPDHRALVLRAVNSHQALVDALENLMELSRSSMQEANRDGCEYDIERELDEAKEAIKKAKGA